MAAPTPDEVHAQRQRRHAETVRLHNVVNALLADIRTGEDWRTWLELGARFDGLGLRNALLINGQRPGATHVADYDTWLARGRHVQRGQHGIRILQPSTHTPMSVFDITQTSGPPWQPPQPTFDLPQMWPVLAQLVQRHGHHAHLHGPLDHDAVAALVHELAHLLLGTAAQPCHGARHLEAESVAFLTARHVGLDTSRFTFPHVHTWAGHQGETSAGVIRAFATRIDEAARRIRAHLDQHLATPPVVPALRPTPVVTHPQPEPAGSPRELVDVHLLAHRYYLDQMPRGWAPRYLTERGFPAHVQQQWGIGWAPPGWDTLLNHLRQHGYSDDIIQAAGLARRTRHGNLIDFFRDRVILPVRAPDGTIVAFIGRAAPNADPGTPKYLNSPETALYKKSDHLIGLHEVGPSLRCGAQPVIVEGALDAIAIAIASDRHAPVAPSGTALTEQQCRLLAENAPHITDTGIAVALDSDTGGRRAAVKAYGRLTAITYELTAIEFPPHGSDPAALLEHHGPDQLRETLKSRRRPLVDLVIDRHIAQWRHRLNTAEGQLAALRSLAPTIAALPPNHVAGRVAYLSHELGITHAEATQAITDTASPPPLADDHPEAIPDLTAAVDPTPRPAPPPQNASPHRRR